MQNGLPFTWMGHVAGGVGRRDEILPAFWPWPGMEEIAAPGTWYDSLAVVTGENSGWRGFEASFVELRMLSRPTRAPGPRAAFTLVSGSSSQDRAGLYLQRGGARTWFRAGTLNEERSGTGLLESHGQHVWFTEVGVRRGDHLVAGAFSQRGVAGSTRVDFGDVEFFPPPRITPPFGALQEDARGEAGSARWLWTKGGRELRATLTRSHDHRESYEPITEVLFAEREAQRNAFELEWSRTSGGATDTTARNVSATRRLAVRVAGAREEARRSEDFIRGDPDPNPAFQARRQALWLAVSDRRPLLGGELELQLGAGYDDTPSRSDERSQLAPSGTWRLTEGGRRWKLHAGRIVTPVWSDLAPGQQAFMQDIWFAGVSLGAGNVESAWFEASALGTETANRALIVRMPVRDVSIRYGWTQEGVRIQDGQVSLALGARVGPFGADASGYARVRPAGSTFANVDPAQGARGGLETRFKLFTGDLAVRLRGEAAWVGERDTEALPGYSSPPVPLPAYATYSASASFALGDATIHVRGWNLEDQPHQQVWSDPSRGLPGAPGTGSGRQYRVEIAWPFFN